MIDNRHEEAFLPDGERNPYYPEPIVPDEIHHGPIHCKPEPKPRKVTVEENIKLSEIRDAFKNLRYKVSMTSFDSYYIPGKKQYQILVLAFNGALDPMIIVNRPGPGEKRIYDYDYALKLYDYYVKNYTAFIKAETKDIQDISIYESLIGYKVTEPKCCFTCKWCKKHHAGAKFQVDVIELLECTNPKNCQAYKFDNEHRHSPFDEHCHNPRIHSPNYFDFDKMCLDMYPNVNIFGVCDNYENMKHFKEK